MITEPETSNSHYRVLQALQGATTKATALQLKEVQEKNTGNSQLHLHEESGTSGTTGTEQEQGKETHCLFIKC